MTTYLERTELDQEITDAESAERLLGLLYLMSTRGVEHDHKKKKHSQNPMGFGYISVILLDNRGD